MSETTASKPSKVKPKIGAPTTFTQETADLICMMLSEGMSLRQILRADTTGRLPHQSTVYDWLIRHPSFAEQYARAREEQADTNADEILQIADEMPPEYTDEKGRTMIDMTYLAWQKQRIEARKWTAMKLKPKKYGEKISVGGDAGNPVQVEAVGEAQGLLDALLLNVELKKQAG